MHSLFNDSNFQFLKKNPVTFQGFLGKFSSSSSSSIDVSWKMRCFYWSTVGNLMGMSFCCLEEFSCGFVKILKKLNASLGLVSPSKVSPGLINPAKVSSIWRENKKKTLKLKKSTVVELKKSLIEETSIYYDFSNFFPPRFHFVTQNHTNSLQNYMVFNKITDFT